MAQPRLPARVVLLAGPALVLALACYDFDRDFRAYCERSGRCDAGASPVPDGGPPDSSGDGGFDAGGDAGFDAGFDGGPDGGGADGGWDGGDGGVDCRAQGLGCTLDRQCCSLQCFNGQCAAPGTCAPHDGGCSDVSDCCSGLGCATTVTPVRCQPARASGRLDEGQLCDFDDQCALGLCDSGVCASRTDCAGVRHSCSIRSCCRDAGVSCIFTDCLLEVGERCVDRFSCRYRRCSDAGLCEALDGG